MSKRGGKCPDGWLCDTGSGFDLVEEDALCELILAKAKEMSEALWLKTANGLTAAKRQVTFKLKCLRGGLANPVLLKSTPPVLSIGYRCMELGYHFEWPPYTSPFFILPDGFKVTLEVKDWVPYISSKSEGTPVDPHGIGAAGINRTKW